MNKRFAAVLVACVSLGLSGCGGGSDVSGSVEDDGSEPAVEAAPVVRSEAEVLLPLDAYMTPDVEMPVLYRALNKLERQCLAGLGITDPGAVTKISPPSGHHDLIYLDEAVVKRYGYRQPYDFVPYEDAAYRKAKKPAAEGELEALDGSVASVNGKSVPKGGCRSWASDQIISPPLEFDATDLAVSVSERVNVDSRVKKATGSWIACMNGAGYSYKNPMDPANFERWGQSGPGDKRDYPLTKKEIETGLHDVACRKESGLYTVWLQVRIAYEKRLVAANEERLVESKRVLDGWMQKAKAVAG
ncbi:hypothetical protein [Actinocorallia aurantiaca]|uniref:Lipoprotein n=1 Tax=Actinocorallia aurantiaca TaxID=46204 RepID=A0ABN3U0W9_9ACTN